MLFSKSLVTKALVGIAFSAASTSTAVAANPACVAGVQGCVIPIPDAAPPVVEVPAPLPPVVEMTPAPVVSGGGLFGVGILPLLAGLAALGFLASRLLDDDKEETSP